MKSTLKQSHWSYLAGLILIIVGCVPVVDNDSDIKFTSESQPFLAEQHRPQYHFTPPSKWMNDPNGMVFYDGEYHLFYQHYPEDIVWGPMHWGHAVSKDLVHWEHLPIALYPDSLGYIFSGSAVIDWNNSSGFGKDGQPPMIAIFTHHDPQGEKQGSSTFQVQSIAYSTDNGRYWNKYQGNPVVPNPGIRDFRDPKVIWDEERNQWVMVFAVWDHVSIYTSKDLKEWTYRSDFGKEWGSHGGVWECPDLFPMRIEGTHVIKWVLLLSINPGGPNGGSATQYFIGDFNGEAFTLDPDFQARLGVIPEAVPEGKVFADFESTRYDNWEKTGFAFGNYPAGGNIMDQKGVEGYKGEKLVNSFFNGDETEGVLKSPTFKINHRYINFLIGGGMHLGKTGIDLVITDRVVKSATGNNSERLSWHSWDVEPFIGQNAHLRIYDQHTGGWGHILVDHITFSDKPASSKIEKAVWLDYGRDNYAGVTWSGIPEDDGRRLFIGWMSNWDYANQVPTESWRSAMTIPRELKLVDNDGNLNVLSQPVKELENLREKVIQLEAVKLDNQSLNNPVIISNGTAEIELDIDFEENSSAHVLIEFSNDLDERLTVGIDQISNTWYIDRMLSGKNEFSANFAQKIDKAPILNSGTKHHLHIFLDVASIEMFVNNGLTTMTEVFFPSKPMQKLDIKTIKGEATVSGKIYSLKSANFTISSNVK